MQAHITSSFYIGRMLKLRLNSPVVNLHGISIGCFPISRIQNPTKVADSNGCYTEKTYSLARMGRSAKDNANMLSIII